jgi:hypothetical protein
VSATLVVDVASLQAGKTSCGVDVIDKGGAHVHGAV